MRPSLLSRIGFITALALIAAMPLSAQHWVKVSAGGEFSVALSSNGSLWAWGANFNGQLGVDDTEPKTIPTRVGTDNDWVDVAAGGFHVLAIKADGSLWAWGFNGNGQLGTTAETQSLVPFRIGDDFDWKSISANFVSSAAIKNDGTLWTWGLNTFGMAGIGSSEQQIMTPSRVASPKTFSKVSCGGLFTLAIATDGTLWGWGYNGEGQLVQQDLLERNIPVQIGEDTWNDVSAGFEYCTGIKSDGTLWSWGLNANGSLGDGTTTDRHTPVPLMPDTLFRAVNAGSAFSFATTQYGEVYGWGINSQGQLGLGTLVSMDIPQWNPDLIGYRMVVPATGIVLQNSIFGFHSLAIDADGQNVCVAGANYISQLGDNSTTLLSLFSCIHSVATGVHGLPAAFPALTPDIYPNPVRDAAVISFTGSGNRDVVYGIYNVLGKLVHSGTVHPGENVRLHTASLPEGTYILAGTDEGGHSVTRAFTVTR